MPSGSLESVPSKSQAALVQLNVNAAVGAWFGSMVRSTIDQVVALPLAASAVAVRPPYCPVGTGAVGVGQRAAHVAGAGAAQGAACPVTEPGSVKPVVAEDLSDQ